MAHTPMCVRQAPWPQPVWAVSEKPGTVRHRTKRASSLHLNCHHRRNDMTTKHDSTTPMNPDEALTRRSEFRATVGLEESLAAAGRHIAERTDDVNFAASEMLREHLTVAFVGTQSALDEAFGPVGEENAARERAQVALGLQRAAILMRRTQPLMALAEKDDMLRHEIEQDLHALDEAVMDDALRTDVENSVAVARICRRDLRALARIVLERDAMLAYQQDHGIETFDATSFDALASAAEARIAPVAPALEQGGSLRRALAADLALEAESAREANVSEVEVAPSQQNVGRVSR